MGKGCTQKEIDFLAEQLCRLYGQVYALTNTVNEQGIRITTLEGANTSIFSLNGNLVLNTVETGALSIRVVATTAGNLYATGSKPSGITIPVVNLTSGMNYYITVNMFTNLNLGIPVQVGDTIMIDLYSNADGTVAPISLSLNIE